MAQPVPPAGVPGVQPPLPAQQQQPAQLQLPGGPPIPPAFGVPTMPLPPAQQHPYTDFYATLDNDPFRHDYAQAFNEFAVPLAGNTANTRPELAQKVYTAASGGIAMAFLLHTRSPTALINAYHRVGRCGPRLGLPTTPWPWDNVGFTFMGDLVDGQAPPSVIWDTDVYFRQLNNQYAVPTPAALDQLLAGDPDQQVFGPFDPAVQGVDLIRTRRSTLVPSRYLGLLFNQGLTPRQAWERLRGSLVTNGHDVACTPLVDWL
jgi:hypothetical protein